MKPMCERGAASVLLLSPAQALVSETASVPKRTTERSIHPFIMQEWKRDRESAACLDKPTFNQPGNGRMCLAVLGGNRRRQ